MSILLVYTPLAAYASPSGESLGKLSGTQEQATIPDGEFGLVETLKKSGYTIFAELLEISGVTKDLEEGQAYTCFAPRNEAFKLEVVEKLKKEPKNEELLELLRYHLLRGYQSKEMILISRRERTLNGKFVLYWITKGEISINNHSVLIETDIMAKGVVIHGVSQILNPDVKGAIP
ncbi:MAG: stabilin-2 precursor [Verrucomicrobiota bacterium]